VIKIFLFISSIRLIPHIICYYIAPNRSIIEADLRRWYLILRNKSVNKNNFIYAFIDIMTFFPAYRNLFYYRLKSFCKALPHLLKFLCRPMSTLFITSGIIGEGLFLQHCFCTIIAAKKIGINCWINQQVTIGYSNEIDCPTIGNNVIINAGAKIIGNVTIGDNSKVGANAVVVKNVPPDCTVVGVPAYIVRRNGIKVRESLK
jgi:serine O-acetyltransferase